MKVIGLCGGSGAGKGTVCSIFAELGIPSIDTDKLYHSLISTDSECTMEIVSAFGSDVYANPGVDRKALRNIVFSSPENLAILNKITHKHILASVRSIIKNTDEARAIIIDAPLLFESGFDKECDVKICVIADEDVRIERIIKRDGISPEIAKARIASQIPNEELKEICDYTIENNAGTDELRKHIQALNKTLFNN